MYGRLQRHHGDTADRRQVPHPGRGARVNHLGQERTNAVEDPADVDVDHAVPVLDRRVPQIPELFDAGVVDQQPHRSDVAVGRARPRSCHGVGITDVADGVDGDGARRGELVSKRRNRFGVDVGEHHRHAEPGGVAGQTRADARTGARDDGHAAAERVASGHDTGGRAAVLREGHRVLGVQNHLHRGEHQTALRPGGSRRRRHRWTRRTGCCW